MNSFVPLTFFFSVSVNNYFFCSMKNFCISCSLLQVPSDPHYTGNSVKSGWSVIEKFSSGLPGWLSWLSVRLPLRSWSHGAWVWALHRVSLSPALGSAPSPSLSAPCGILSLSLCPLLTCICSVSLSKKKFSSCAHTFCDNLRNARCKWR